MLRSRLLTAAAALCGAAGLAALAPLAASAVVAAPSDVKAGVDAWKAGNYEAAIRIWRPLADAGDADAQFNLAQAYKLGRGVPDDLNLAQSWYEKAARQGHQQAQANLGLILFQNGQRDEAMPWIEKAAEAGDPRAEYVLGTALFNGDIVEKDWTRAYAMMTLAAQQNLPPATTSLTEMDKYIPLDQRQKGVVLAKQLQASAVALADAAPVPSGNSAMNTQRVAVPGPGPASAKAPVTPPAKQPSQVFTPAQPPLVKTAPVRTASAVPQPKPAPAPAKPAPANAATPGGRWRIQLGAFGSPQLARSQWASISSRVSALGGLSPSYEPYSGLTRLRVGPLANKAAADRVCAAAKSAGQACFPVAP